LKWLGASLVVGLAALGLIVSQRLSVGQPPESSPPISSPTKPDRSLPPPSDPTPPGEPPSVPPVASQPETADSLPAAPVVAVPVAPSVPSSLTAARRPAASRPVADPEESGLTPVSAIPQLTPPGTPATPAVPFPASSLQRVEGTEPRLSPVPADPPDNPTLRAQTPGVPPPASGQPRDPEPTVSLPPPRPLGRNPLTPFSPGQVRLPSFAGESGIVGSPPRPSPATQQRYAKFVKELVDPQMTLDLVVGRTRLMLLQETPARIQIAEESLAGYTLLSSKELSLLGKQVGVTVLTLWFGDAQNEKKQEILTYHVRIVPDPEGKERLERVYCALADQINHAFVDSVIGLHLVGDKLVVSGHCKDIAQASQILKIVRANAPCPQQIAPMVRPIIGPTGLPVDGASAACVENCELAGCNWVVNLLRVGGEQQVMLKVTVAEVNRSAARSIGLNFSLSNNKGQTVFANNTGSIATGGGILPGSGIGQFGFGFNAINFNLPPGVVVGNSNFNNLPVSLDFGQVRLAIDALRNLDYARSLAEPNLVTMNGQTANFHAGGQFPVPVVTGTTFTGLQGVSFVPYGVQLSFTPYITDRDRVRLVMAAEVSTRDLEAGVVNIGGTAVPNLSTRNFQTTVELREGQTLAVAGLIQNNLGGRADRIPLLGDLPFLGNLTGFSRVQAGEQELVVLVTPELVHPIERKDVPPLPGSDLFEPSDLEFYLLGRLESHHGEDYRSPIRTDWSKIMNYHRYERVYLSGPSGMCSD
jgi:pilus assembly protein CpaC